MQLPENLTTDSETHEEINIESPETQMSSQEGFNQQHETLKRLTQIVYTFTKARVDRKTIAAKLGFTEKELQQLVPGFTGVAIGVAETKRKKALAKRKRQKQARKANRK